MKEYRKIEPHRITKPIQLLAAWLLGLIFVNGAFLIAAGQITQPDWVSGIFVVASIMNESNAIAAAAKQLLPLPGSFWELFIKHWKMIGYLKTSQTL